jgi:hypothetical protein
MSELETVTMIVSLLLGPGSMAILFVTAILANSDNLKRTIKHLAKINKRKGE